MCTKIERGNVLKCAKWNVIHSKSKKESYQTDRNILIAKNEISKWDCGWSMKSDR